jgi:hypothetical protein
VPVGQIAKGTIPHEGPTFCSGLASSRLDVNMAGRLIASSKYKLASQLRVTAKNAGLHHSFLPAGAKTHEDHRAPTALEDLR